jgi:hypothetical protein
LLALLIALVKEGRKLFMAKRRGNPIWGKRNPAVRVIPAITEFDLAVREYKVAPDQYLRSTRLRKWALENWNSRYVRETLLKAWGFKIDSAA